MPWQSNALRAAELPMQEPATAHVQREEAAPVAHRVPAPLLIAAANMTECCHRAVPVYHYHMTECAAVSGNGSGAGGAVQRYLYSWD